MKKEKENRNLLDQNSLRELDAPGNATATTLDPQEVFNASIEFENRISSSASRFSTGPRHSSTFPRLYPSLDSLDQTGSEDFSGSLEAISSHKSPSKRSPVHCDTSITTALETDAAAVASLPVASLPRSEEGSTNPGVAAATFRSATATATASYETHENDDMIAEKIAAYYGSSAVYATAEVSSEDDDMIAMKNAAYEGYCDFTDCVSSTAPFESSGHSRDDNQTTVGTVVNSTESVVIEEENTLGQATANTWDGFAAAEATLWQEFPGQEERANLDSKPPARGPSSSSLPDSSSDDHLEAIIVPIADQPSNYEESMTVRAQVVSQENNSAEDASNTRHELDESSVPAEAAEVIDISLGTMYQVDGQQVATDQIAEAAILDSDHVDGASNDARDASTHDEGRVMEEGATSHSCPFASKGVGEESCSNGSWQVETCPDGDEFGMSTGEAEVVEVREDFHPAEFVEQESTQAELVGSDSNTAIAVPSNDHDQGNIDAVRGPIEQAEVIFEGTNYVIPELEQQRPEEAEATILTNDGMNNDRQESPSVVAEPILGDGRSTSDPLPATPVTVMHDSSTPPLPQGVSFSDPMKQEAYTGRAASAPVIAEIMEDPMDQNARQAEWERVPSFGGIPGSAPEPIPSSAAIQPMQAPACSVDTDTRQCSSGAPNNSNSGIQQMLSSGSARGANNVIDTLFGGNGSNHGRQSSASSFSLDQMSGSVVPRTLLPSSVIFSEPTSSWVATVNTNQKALEANNVEESSKALKAFSVPTRKQAVALARAWAPPQMHPFEANPKCFLCESPFTIFRRACHCRNCGVCICGQCTIQWPAKMVPVTYNSKKVSAINVCKSCNWLCSEFRSALLQGDHDKAVALHSTGNVNLTTPFANVKGELFYPVHCAVLGGSLELLQWLVDEHCCPLRSIRISNGKVRGNGGSYTPILTSKGRSLLGIALGNRNIGIVRYLVVEKKMLLSAEKNLDVDTLVANLDLVLRILPDAALSEQTVYSFTRQTNRFGDGFTEPSEGDTAEISAIGVPNSSGEMGNLADSECIICFDNPIDCVMTPCGHQICCLQCGNHISRCPVCAVECSPMRVFKP